MHRRANPPRAIRIGYNSNSAINGALQPVIAFQIGQVAQMVERSPEKAGVGGSIPSLATITTAYC